MPPSEPRSIRIMGSRYDHFQVSHSSGKFAMIELPRNGIFNPPLDQKATTEPYRGVSPIRPR